MSKKQITQQRITSTLQKIIDLFEKGDVPEAIAITTFPRYEVPANGWSLSNRILMMIAGTSDARGYKAWKQVGRTVKQGQKAFYILAPRIIRKEIEGQEEQESVLVGFIPIPVFAVEQTEGKDLEHESIELPELPLMDKAREWDIDVKGVSFQGKFYGYYQQKGDKENIRLATPSEKTFFHELAHAADRRVKGSLKHGQDPKQEVVAEIAAQVLSQLVGTQMENTMGNSFEYINHYAKKSGKSLGKMCLSVIGDIEKVLQLILSSNPIERR